MTKVDFNLIAETLRETPAGPTRDDLIERFAAKLKADNPRFDATTFKVAAGFRGTTAEVPDSPRPGEEVAIYPRVSAGESRDTEPGLQPWKAIFLRTIDDGKGIVIDEDGIGWNYTTSDGKRIVRGKLERRGSGRFAHWVVDC